MLAGVSLGWGERVKEKELSVSWCVLRLGRACKGKKSRSEIKKFNFGQESGCFVTVWHTAERKGEESFIYKQIRL